ncbi:preprotein translocase subunit SecY [Buchananella hordeovulneris]|uniref:Protein translocase subunit SecY n=1 Tax=Buchananella hordeovulneris TaxID=52770 RepID=A0A1Q5PZ57_9ACTO|nr:preprotein translocase subunit SecY [Buchananella hordeovulneris]MDO5081497.1 preprotein translocase subunit SecY [Buchananella hordeovulneris]OKL52742.1 preprotein translocase subunit SecY [Buchananella hordeovulneris]RRD43838.1 preprotein translocase subunit SecY [Buchananella hordeovulneris]RRD52004.1 preprotein translocase subunit SecY [Buchananella hordeovulneris]
MLTAFVQAFRTPDLRRKLLFTLGIMAVFRLGSYIPTPGVSYKALEACVDSQNTGGLLDLVNIFSGGALLQLSVFALGIMPYITASIIIQLLRVAVPRFEDLHQEGQAGQAKLTQYTRYLTIGLAVLQSTTIITLARTGRIFSGCTEPLLVNDSVWTFVLMILTMTAGTGLIMWLGELITERGIGNGMSLLIFTSIVAGFPASMLSIGQSNNGWTKFAVMLALILAITLAVVYVEQSTRRIPVQYAKRMVGRRLMGGTTTYIPIKINMSGVIPVIFASSILALPALAVQFANPQAGWALWIQRHLAQTSWGYLAIYGLLVLFFAFFYTAITFNPDEVADNMKKYGGFIPGIRAGQPTANFLRYVVSRITTAGAIYLLIIALLPTIAMNLLKIAQLPFGGTTILIIVGVGLQTVKEINSQLQQRHYEGFLA